MTTIDQSQVEEIRQRAFILPSKNLQPNPAKGLVFEALALLEATQTEKRDLQQRIADIEAVCQAALEVMEYIHHFDLTRSEQIHMLNPAIAACRSVVRMCEAQHE